ncbi:hypothetical protein Pmani_014159 [Petrolisthes manimaculis]|uniref:RNA helicase n=1 Tax=Petrolisthes manimaculis TaxID=1843537 RepID=A0AAE1UCW5_9EUCA|nr:hypothetical protein Pmani_014159 [Petrolisthes manimaculis]
MSSVGWAQDAEQQESQEAKVLADKVDGLELTTETEGETGQTNDAPTTAPSLPIAAPPPPAAAPPPLVANDATSEEGAVTAADLSLMRKVMRKGIVETKNNVEIYQKDPNNPLYSVKSFEALNLRPELLRGIYEMGFKLPSKIQEFSLPTLLAEPPSNLIAQSQSGTGKTAAFTLAMLSRIDPNKKCTQALVVSPTMELALQTLESVRQMGKYCTDITIRSAVKGDMLPRGQQVNEHIVIGTPGKLVDWTSKYKCLDLRSCKVFVLDEADVMIATQGHQDQSVRIHKQLPKECQMMLFSATYVDEVVNFAKAIFKDPVTFRLRREDETLKNIRQMYVECNSTEEKYEAISNIFTSLVGSAMFFCHTKHTATFLAKRLIDDGYQVGILTGDLTADERVKVLQRFRDGTERVLICTNVLARGIDVESVNLVVNYDLPQHYDSRRADTETYLHRIGRCGRFGKTGNAINIVDGIDDLRILKEVEDHFGVKVVKLDYNSVEDIEKLED